MKTSRIYDHGADTPVDRTAANVVKNGEHWEAKNKLNAPLWTSPPPMKPVLRGNEDLSGHKFGRFRVLGVYAESERLYWVVRCTCGNFELRRPKAIKNKKNSLDRCARCRHLLFLKREEHYLAYGKDKELSPDD
jgi:hypothetical protein